MTTFKKECYTMSSNRILSFYIGETDGSAIFTDSREEFFEYLNEKIDESEKNGKEHFDIIIEPTEC